jgi:hypothetical protein
VPSIFFHIDHGNYQLQATGRNVHEEAAFVGLAKASVFSVRSHFSLQELSKYSDYIFNPETILIPSAARKGRPPFPGIFSSGLFSFVDEIPFPGDYSTFWFCITYRSGIILSEAERMADLNDWKTLCVD